MSVTAEMELKRKRLCAPVRNSSLWYLVNSRSGPNIEVHGDELGQNCYLQAQRDVSIAVIVVLFENVGHALQTNTRLYKEIETHVVVATSIVSAI